MLLTKYWGIFTVHFVFIRTCLHKLKSTQQGLQIGKSNERAADSTPVNTPCSTTILSSVRLNSQTAYTVYRGGTTAEQFAEYLKNTLLLTLSKDDIIVMDNMRSHHSKSVKEVLNTSGINTCIFLPTVRILILLKKCGQRSKRILGR